MKDKQNLIYHLVCLCVLCVGFWLWRYRFLELHLMKQWPETLFYAGLFVLLVSFCAKGKLTPALLSLGYSIGFAAGLRFETFGTDPGGGRTGTMWKIWGLTYLTLTMAGIAADMIWSARKGRKSEKA